MATDTSPKTSGLVDANVVPIASPTGPFREDTFIDADTKFPTHAMPGVMPTGTSPATSGSMDANTAPSASPTGLSREGEEVGTAIPTKLSSGAGTLHPAPPEKDPGDKQQETLEGKQQSYAEKKHILVFGSSGSGKSTLINHIAGSSLPTSINVRGVTLDSTEVSGRHGNVNYRIIDTAGLNEDEEGTVPSEEARKNLEELLKRTTGGLNLMVMVTRGRISETSSSNYDLFVTRMTSSKIPLVIVQTHLDDEDDPSQWAVENVDLFKTNYLVANELVGVAFPRFNPRRDSSELWAKTTCKESTDRVWAAIERCSSSTPTMFCERSGLPELLRSIWETINNRVGRRTVGVQNQTRANRGAGWGRK